MNRPKRDTAQVQRFKATPQTQTRGIKKPATLKAPKQPVKKTLDLTLKKLDAKSYDIKNPASEFYEKYFDNPDDSIAKRFKALDYTSKPKFNIPSFKNGITNFNLKDSDSIPLRVVSFKDFKDNLYAGRSNSDGKTYTARINKFTNQLPSFKKYQKDDDLSWMIRENRLLLCEILEYAIAINASLSLIEGELVTVMRIINLSFGTKLTPLYMKYQAIVSDTRVNTLKSEGENTFNEAELRKGGLIPWEMVINKQEELQKRFYSIDNQVSKEGYALNQELLLVSLYGLIPPLCNEPKFLEYTQTKQDTGDWVLMQGKEAKLDLNEVKKKHDPIQLTMTERLQKILLDSYALYPRKYVFTDVLKYPKFDKKAALMTMNNRLENLFKGSQYKVGASMLRSSYVTYRYDKQLTYNQKEEIARRMRTSIEIMERNYLKILTEPVAAIVDIPDTVVRANAKPVATRGKIVTAPAQPVLIVQKGNTASTPMQYNMYEKHLESGRKYYSKNKNKILERQKKYRKEHKTEDAQRKILKWLNTDEDYINVVRQKTIDKYNIKKANGVYI
jgi:hypothetical protein